jgi:two-component system response regulator AtoC
VPGVFEQAQGGTVFLDEVGKLAPQAQAALLRVLEQQRIVRVGGTKEVVVDARIVAATHRNLNAMVGAGTFREDLMFRLDALTLRVPPLRERREEILPLAERFVAHARERWSGSASELSDEVREALSTYRWPGNVRQLKNVVERAVAVCAGSVIELEDLPEEVWLESSRSSPAGEGVGDAPAPADSIHALRSLPALVREFEIAIIGDALAKAGGNQAQAARLLGVPRRTLTSKVQVLGLLTREPH